MPYLLCHHHQKNKLIKCFPKWSYYKANTLYVALLKQIQQHQGLKPQTSKILRYEHFNNSFTYLEFLKVNSYFIFIVEKKLLINVMRG